MPKFCVCITDEMPSQECVVEAPSAEAATAIRQRDLVDWADMAGLKAEPMTELAEEKKAGRP